MRVIAGLKKGIRLAAPEGDEITRPTSDRAKEALFGSLQFDIAGSAVLDLFAGSGALGIEALSRGAGRAVFVDSSRQAIAAINANLTATRLAGSASVLAQDCFSAMNTLEIAGESFDFVFLDPPYKSGLYGEVLAELARGGLLKSGGVIIAEHEENTSIEPPAGLEACKTKKYGKALLTFIRRGDGPDKIMTDKERQL